MSEPKNALLRAIENSRKAQGILEEVSREERRPTPPEAEDEKDQSNQTDEEPQSGSDASAPS